MFKYISIATEECGNVPTTLQHFFETTTTDDYDARIEVLLCLEQGQILAQNTATFA